MLAVALSVCHIDDNFPSIAPRGISFNDRMFTGIYCCERLVHLRRSQEPHSRNFCEGILKLKLKPSARI